MAERENLDRIIAGCKNGDAESFSQMVDMYAGRCYGYFYRLTGNRAVSDDLLSELFIKLVEKIGSFKGGSFESWLFKKPASGCPEKSVAVSDIRTRAVRQRRN